MSFVSGIVSCALPSGRLAYQRLQQSHVPQIVSWLIDRGFRDERRLPGSRIVQQAAKRLQTHSSLADMLVAVAPRTPRVFGVVAMPDAHILQAHGLVQQL